MAPARLIRRLSGLAILFVAFDASARPEGPEFETELAALDKSLAHPAPAPGRDRAAGGPPRWCRGVHLNDVSWPSQIASNLESYRKGTMQQGSLIEAAAAVCTLPTEPAYQRAAAEIEQSSINETGLSEADAVASLAVRADHDGWSAGRDKLCDVIKWPDSAPHDVQAIATSRMKMFGCDGTGDSDHVAWMDVHPQMINELDQFLDGGIVDRDHDELARLVWVSEEIAQMLEPQGKPNVLARYGVVQFDIQALAYDVALKQVDALYRGNAYARTVALETVAHTRLAVARLEAAVAKQTKDPRWKELILTVPQAAASAWLAAANKNAALLARTEALAAAVAANAPEAHDCEAKLRADVQPILKGLPHGSKAELESAISGDPVAGLVLRRLAACMEANEDRKDRDSSGAVGILAQRVDAFKGPRGAASVAMSKAVYESKGAKAFSASDVAVLDEHVRGWFGQDSSASSFYKGVIQSAVRAKDGSVKVTFRPDRYQYTVQNCTETNKVDRVLSDGKLVYRQVCHDAGTAWSDKAPPPMTVPASCAAGLVKGRLVYPERGIPYQVFTDGNPKKLAAIHCLSLE